MLGRAVKEHHPDPGRQDALQTQKPSALKPVQPSILNSRSSWPASGNPLKRTASQISGGLSFGGSQEKMSSRSGSIEQHRPSQERSRLDSLHANVLFDENDFDDDENIDLDDDRQSSSDKKLVGDSSRPRHPQLPPNSQDREAQLSSTLASESLYPQMPTWSSKPNVTPKTPASSAPIPWSSSPSTHYQMPPPKATAPTPKQTGSKRRLLPWVEEEKDNKAAQLDSDGPPVPIGNALQGKRFHGFDKDTATPPSKKRSNNSLPWNTTASAVKDEQKKLRQGHRKLVKDNVTKNMNGNPVKKPKRESLPKVFLSDEQKQVLDLVSDGRKSVFFTGSAGTGKSVLLREIIKVLRRKYMREPDRVAVTASTGLAACNVGGVTLHSYAGIGLGKEDVPTLVKKIKRNQKAKTRWLRTKILIIDEISMVDGDLFDKLESIARAVRNNGRPFGGIQLVITGDFFQLPPVPDYHQTESKFAFDAATWNTSIEHTIGLNQVFRQKDPVFANMLNEMRLGKLTQRSIDSFRSLSRGLSFDDDFQATELFPTRIEVDNANNAKMRNLLHQEFEFKALDGGVIQDLVQRDKLLQNCMAPALVRLKEGAQVMLIKNIDETLVNGSVGKVCGFMDEKNFELLMEDEEEFKLVKGMASDDEEMTRSRKILKQKIRVNSTGQRWPYVQFGLADGTSRSMLVQPESWKIELPSGEVQASRLQVPLILAWALSIHKAQGQTLERVKVDLGKIFEKGQAYVALSRATCQEGLQILRFDPRKVMAHEKVRHFYDKLYCFGQPPARKAVSGKSTVDENVKRRSSGRGYHGGSDEEELAAMYG